jgi:GGDEF domain-containing protein
MAFSQTFSASSTYANTDTALVKKADRDLYKAKKAGKNRVAFFE